MTASAFIEFDQVLTAEKQGDLDTILRPGFGTRHGTFYQRLTGLSRATFSRRRRWAREVRK